MNDDVFNALGNSYRRKIILLLRDGEKSAGEIVSNFDIAQPSISRHLDVLKKANIVYASRIGNQIIYSLNSKTMEELVVCCAKMLPFDQ